MSTQQFIEKLNALIHSNRDQEPAICELLGRSLGGPERDKARLFVFSRVYQDAFAQKCRKLFGTSARSFNGISNRNLKVCLRVLQRLVYLIDPPAGASRCGDFSRPFLFPFVLSVCLRVNRPMENRTYLLPFDQTFRITREVARIFKPHSFAEPALVDRLFPVSCFPMKPDNQSMAGKFARAYG